MTDVISLANFQIFEDSEYNVNENEDLLVADPRDVDYSDANPFNIDETQVQAATDEGNNGENAPNEGAAIPTTGTQNWEMRDGVPYYKNDSQPPGHGSNRLSHTGGYNVPPSHPPFQPLYPSIAQHGPSTSQSWTQGYPAQQLPPQLAASQNGLQTTQGGRRSPTLVNRTKETAAIGLDKKPKGEVRMVNGELQQREGPWEEWGRLIEPPSP